ncbi:MAG: hypothetical protein ACOC8O_01535 [Natronomonas sp.]
MLVNPVLFVLVALGMLILVIAFLLYITYSSLKSDRHSPSLEKAS